MFAPNDFSSWYEASISSDIRSITVSASGDFLHDLVDRLPDSLAQRKSFLLNGFPVSNIHDLLKLQHGHAVIFRHGSSGFQVSQGAQDGFRLSKQQRRGIKKHVEDHRVHLIRRNPGSL